jgi:predicted alpha-1,2-mannosidase
MRRIPVLLSALALVVGLVAPAHSLPGQSPVDYVDPMIGTAFGGFTFPGPDAPFGMVQVSPDTEGEFSYTGYQYLDNFIRGFSLHHIESMGVKSAANVPFMPSIGPVTSSDPRTWMSHFSHANEDAQAGYYRVLLDRFGIETELTASTRVAWQRYTFPPSPQASVILDVGRSADSWDVQDPSGSVHQSSLTIVNDHLVTGWADSDQGYRIHFASEFDHTFTGHGVWQKYGDAPTGGETAEGRGAGGYVSFDTTNLLDSTVTAKIGVSFVSVENALLNLDVEAGEKSFDDVRSETRAAWADALDTIEVTGGTDADMTAFYTALYHAQQHPNIYSDVNGEYMGHDGRVHVVTDHEHYANFSLWDTYRGETQLLALIQPQRSRDMVLSLLDIYDQVGRLPLWALNNALPDFMIGDPVQMTIVDNYCRGLLDGTDVDKFYAALRHNAFEFRRTRDPSYLDKGWIALRPSDTLEYAISDFALALMADSLDHDADRDELLGRAHNYDNVIDAETGFARPRQGDGNWLSPYDPGANTEPDGNNFKEGTGWQYTWLVPQDPRGLFDIVGGNGRGGDAAVIDRLDQFFSTAVNQSVPGPVPEVQKDITVFGVLFHGDQYAPSNEHDIQAPYLYNYIGQPWKTQALVRSYQSLFHPAPDGLPGNDDLGTMSAWYIWSAIGFYPIAGGAPMYTVGSPVFTRTQINPVGGEPMVIDAPGASLTGKYVQSARLGTGPLTRPWFTHAQLLDAKAVSFAMGPVANETWGSAMTDAPPSLTGSGLADFGCPRREVPKPVATTLSYTGNTRSRGQVVDLAARLTTADGTPVAQRLITFSVAGQTLTATTDADGIASTSASIPNHGKSQVVTVSFLGDGQYRSSASDATISWGIPKVGP